MTKLSNFIDGRWVNPSTGEYGESLNPAKFSEVIAQYPLS